MDDRRLIRRVVLRNYKSIAACDVRPAQLSLFVGRNGSGKSNFLDALRFVADSTRFSLDHALRDRGGINEVRRRSGGHPTHFGIRLEFGLPTASGHYAFSVGAKPRGGYEVQSEECLVVPRDGSPEYYRVESGEVVKATLPSPPPAAPDRLYLVRVAGMPALGPLHHAMEGMGFYNLNPGEIRDLQSPDPGDLLSRDGRNVASVLANLASRSPELKTRIEEYLAKVSPGISGVDVKGVGPKETLEFRQEVRGSPHPWKFLATSMSDGTLRALGILLALFQAADDPNGGSRLVGIEEPELGLHPAAAGVLIDGLQEASESAQILVTSHSPDLLDHDELPEDSIFAVVSDHGETQLATLDDAGRSALRDHLYTAGELLRMDQLQPDPRLAQISPAQLNLFGPEA